MTSNVEKLRRKFQELGVTNFGIIPGPNWNNLSLEEKAGVVLETIEAIEKGDYEEMPEDDCCLDLPAKIECHTDHRTVQ